jgi:hypothetical protein
MAAVATNYVPLTSGWIALGLAAPLMIQAVGGPIEIVISSTGAPGAGTSGMLLFPNTAPFVTFSSTTGIVYAMAAAGACGVGVIVANAS